MRPTIAGAVPFALLVGVAVAAPVAESQRHLVPQPLFDAIASEYSGEAAQETTRRIVQYHRIQGSPMMAEVATDVVLAKLRALGIESSIEQFPSDGKTRYQTFISPMGWDMRGGELWVESVAGEADFEPIRLCRYADVPMCVSTYSKGGEWSGELVEVGAGTADKDYEGKTVAGRVVLASGYAGEVVRQAAVKRGAVGVVIYPDPLDRPDHPDMVRYNGIWPRAEELEKTSGGFQISASDVARLRALMRRGAVRVRGKIDATLGPGKLTLVHAWIRGTEHPDREVLITAHLDHPKWSANDNASGSGALLEMARTVQALVASGKAKPRCTLHFLWVPEFFGTMAYVTKHSEARAAAAGGPGIVANLNMDMVGEDTVKTSSRFYFTRTPDSVPSLLDALLEDALEQTKEKDLVAPSGSRNTWPAESVPYSQGSDHDVFLGLGVPSTMLGHDPDWTHHTSEDTIDKTDATEFRRVGAFAAAAAYWIAGADDAQWQRLAPAVAAEKLRADSERLVRLQRLGDGRLVERLQKEVAADAEMLATARLNSRGELLSTHKEQKPGGTFARRATIGPIAGSAFEGLTGGDKRFLDDARKEHPNFDLILFEAVGFMNGRRSNREIADLLSIEFGEHVPEDLVNRVTEILGSLKLAQPEQLR